MDDERLNSPLLHQDIYLKHAIDAVLSRYRTTHQTVFALTAEPRGWRLTLMDPGIFSRKDETLLRDVMNAILVHSLEKRLAGMTQ